jgi:hypothetical protein
VSHRPPLYVPPHVVELDGLANEWPVVLLEHDAAGAEGSPSERNAFRAATDSTRLTVK